MGPPSETAKGQDDPEQILNRIRSMSQRAATYANRIINESDAFAVEVKSLQQALKTALKTAKALPPERQALKSEQLAQLREAKDVLEGLGPGGDLRKFLKPRNPLLIRLLLGDNINLVAIRRDRSMAMKEEYHRFRDRTAWLMLLGPLVLYLALWHADKLTASCGSGAPAGDSSQLPVMAPWVFTGVHLYLAFLSYFYLALALRESVLMVNGSHIKPWWVQHHYWSATASLLLLALPITSPAVYLFFRHFLLWSCFQALVMFLQNFYQRQRMYTRIALGRNTAMDVVAGESSGASGQLLLLLPLLVALQSWQFGIGTAIMLRMWRAWLSPEGWLQMEPAGTDLRGMRGVFLVGAVFVYMAARNFATTVSTVVEKRIYKSKMRKTKSKGASLAEAGAAPPTAAKAAKAQ